MAGMIGYPQCVVCVYGYELVLPNGRIRKEGWLCFECYKIARALKLLGVTCPGCGWSDASNCACFWRR